MNSSKYRFTLDMHSGQSQISLPVVLNDTKRKLYISLADGGKLYHIEDGCLALIRVNRPTGTYLAQFCPIEDNTNIVYDFGQYIYTAIVEGLHECEVTLYGLDGGVLTTARFSMVVSERVVNSDNAEVTDENWTEIDSIVAEEAKRQQAFKEAIAAAEEATANAIAVVEEFEERFTPKVVDVTLLSSAWTGSGDLWSQVVSIDGVTELTQVDLTPTAEQLAIFHEKDLAFVTENIDGVVTVYAIGDKPKNDYIIPATLTEVKA